MTNAEQLAAVAGDRTKRESYMNERIASWPISNLYFLCASHNAVDSHSTMARIDDDDSLQVVPPQAIDEQSPLLGNADGQPDNGTIEAQAEQERREYEAGHVPLAEEPPLSKMLVIMGSLWACVSSIR